MCVQLERVILETPEDIWWQHGRAFLRCQLLANDVQARRTGPLVERAGIELHVADIEPERRFADEFVNRRHRLRGVAHQYFVLQQHQMLRMSTAGGYSHIRI